MMMRSKFSFHLSLCALLIACNGGDDGGQGDSESAGETAGEGGEEGGLPPDPTSAVDEAQATIPDYLTLHSQVISRTCSPDEGVCHHAKEYPDLTTPLAMLATIDTSCNIALDDVIDTFNGCERIGDFVTILYGANEDFSSEVAWTEPLMDGNTITGYRVHLRDAIPGPDNDSEPDSVRFDRHYSDEVVPLEHFYGWVTYQEGERWLDLGFYDQWEEWHLTFMEGNVRFGDPNRDGLFGADDPAHLTIAAGAPERSYLLERILGTVPGTPMPLANQAFSSAEILALTCWIEGLDPAGGAAVGDLIDYEACEAAANFGQGSEGSGHSFSTDVRPILNRCTDGPCHDDEDPAAALDLASDSAWQNLLAQSIQDPETPLVTPGNPTHSYLMTKLRGPGLSGLQMPRTPEGEGTPLTDEELATIEAWIVAGAPND